MNVHIRWMVRRDMPEVLGIERGSFEHSWSEEDFIRCLRQRNCTGMVAEHDEKVVGFMIYELHKDRLLLLNIAVDPNARRSTVGKQMIEKLKGKLHPERRKKAVVYVRESNLAAQSFFKSQGYHATSVVRDFYDDVNEDAYVFEYGIVRATKQELKNRISGVAK